MRDADRIFDLPPSHWFYHHCGPASDMPVDMPNVSLIPGIPDDVMLQQNCSSAEHKAIVIDDGLTELLQCKDFLTNLVTRVAHHMNVSVFIISQSLFLIPRPVRINCNYFILMKNPQDKLSLSNLARQCFPRTVPAIVEAFQDATSRPHGYLCLDLHQSTEEQARVCTDIFADSVVVYVPRRK